MCLTRVLYILLSSSHCCSKFTINVRGKKILKSQKEGRENGKKEDRYAEK